MRKTGKMTLLLTVVILLFLVLSKAIQAHSPVHDPGVRGGPAGAGGAIPGLTASEQKFFDAGLEDFVEAEGVGDGLGPRFNLDSCAGCHTQPAVGGTSPAVNPQVAIATAFGARNAVPSFITPDGPIREARFKFKPDGTRDGSVHALYVISGRVDDTGDASGCNIAQEDFAAQLARNNVIFRIPTPMFGAGLIEMIPDSAISANLKANTSQKAALGIFGRHHVISGVPNLHGNDGTIMRFGWKAQNKSLLVFSGEAYNVEMGITNELFQTERDETTNCQYATVPNDVTNTAGATGLDTISAIEKFAFFMRFLAPPIPSSTTPGGSTSITNGRKVFVDIGCAFCHTPTLTTGNTTVAALRYQAVNLFSDLALHRMGPGLADGISQGVAKGDEFRAAPLWGLGQRIFFLHDGRTKDLVQVIQAHRSAGNSRFGPSEANQVIDNFNELSEDDQQDLLYFLRSL
jgi:CxxC motif-containing protein (DUF1111 family)